MVSQTKSKKIPARTMLPLFFGIAYCDMPNIPPHISLLLPGHAWAQPLHGGLLVQKSGMVVRVS